MQNSIFVSKCRIFRNRLLFLHPKGGPKASGRLPPNTSQQTGTTCTWRSSPQAPLHNKSEHTEAKIRGKFFMLASKGPRVSLPSMCRITHTDAMAMHQPADFPKRLPPVSLSHTVCLSLAACFMPQSFGHAAAIYYYSYHIRVFFLR